MLLSNLYKSINIKKTYNFKNNNVFKSITSNSKFTNKNTIFVYDFNSKVKTKYIKEAIQNKVPAIITNKYIKITTVPQFIVSNINLEIEELLKQIYKNLPNKTIAITGTNGKTSVVWYISKILTLLNYNNSSLGTIGYFENNIKKYEVNLTTPAYEEIYKYGSLNKKKDNIFIFEASSHALDQNRLRNYPVDIAAITNISDDHLDYHKNMLNYKKAKYKLFTKYLLKQGSAVINSRIKNITELKNKLLKNKIKLMLFGNNYVSLKEKEGKIILKINKKNYKLNKLKLKTDIEYENLECAIAIILELNIKIKKIIPIISKITNPPGRLQKLNFDKKKSVIIIDYAHTPDALKKTLIALKRKSKKPVLVFGCGGERDKNKREKMGQIAKKYASRVYITDDNPRNENPYKIRRSILKHCPDAVEISSRKKAIKKALNELKIEEILLIAGKGHEKFQIIKNKKIKFDDYEIAKNIIKQ